MEVTLLGATDTVTGSRTLVKAGAQRVLVDCGLFQGVKRVRSRNWQPFPTEPSSIDAVVLTHAHLDHSGYVPALIRQGFRGPVFCTAGTADLLAVLWPDSGYLQEEDAAFRNRHKTTRHEPALPLYTADEGRAALSSLRPCEFGESIEVAPGVRARLQPVGHIIGASSVQLEHRGARVGFSGDVGREQDVLMRPPAPPPPADLLIVESTYGNRSHRDSDPEEELGAILRRTVKRKGVLLVPAFAVGRAQTLLHLLTRLMDRDDMPTVPVFLNSPMAITATEIFSAHVGEHRLTRQECERMAATVQMTRSPDESRALNRRNGPMIIVSASGMATGGRILHHLARWLPDPRATVLFTGFQAAGTRGEALLAGAPRLKIHGQYLTVGAEIERLDSLSAHADCDELIAWLRRAPTPPSRVLINHGEPSGQDALRREIGDALGWRADLAVFGQAVRVG